jgi:hypothetical protein
VISSSTLADSLTAKEKAQEEELMQVKVAVTEAREQLQALREDNGRKSKLLAALREARAGDAAALEQLQGQVKDAEECNKRYCADEIFLIPS